MTVTTNNILKPVMRFENARCEATPAQSKGLIENMNDDQQPKRYHYKVTLKTGEFSTFPNDNNSENYESRLVSGIYGITTKDGTKQITPDDVASIEKIEVKKD